MEAKTYTPELDQENYAKLKELPLNELETERIKLDLYTDKQLQTLLAERFNVLTSTFNYEIKDGELWGENMNEPALDSFKRGRDYRRIYGNSIDYDREDAEVVGFSKIQQMLNEERVVLSISPKGGEGSTYQHNFYDIFTIKNGKVEARRYSSALNIDEYQKLLSLEYKTPEEFLENPIDISGRFASIDDVHESLHKDHKTTSDEIFYNFIIPGTSYIRKQLLQAYYEGDEEAQEYWFNAHINAAEEIKEWASQISENDVFVNKLEHTEEDYDRLAKQKVKEVGTGCGTSGGFKKNGRSPFSVSEFGNSEGESKWFTCPDCNFEANGPIGNTCPNCGLTKEKYAESAEEVC